MNALVPQNNMSSVMASLNAFAPVGKPYMKFNANTGVFSHSKEDIEIPIGDEVALNMSTFSTGWVCWKDSEVIDEKISYPMAGEAATREEDLPDHEPYEAEDDGWKKQVGIEITLLDGEHAGQTFIFNASSSGGISALVRLFKKYYEEGTLKGFNIVPVVKLDNQSFMPKEKKYGKKYAPVFEIVEWTTEAELAKIAKSTNEDSPENYEEKVPAKETKKADKRVSRIEQAPAAEAPAKAPAATPEAATAAPGQRRRRFE